MRTAVEAHFGPGALDRPARRRRGGHIPLSPGVKRSPHLALRETLNRGGKEISTWHLLIGTIDAEPVGSDRQLGRDGIGQSLRAAAVHRLGNQAA